MTKGKVKNRDVRSARILVESVFLWLKGANMALDMISRFPGAAEEWLEDVVEALDSAIDSKASRIFLLCFPGFDDPCELELIETQQGCPRRHIIYSHGR